MAYKTKKAKNKWKKGNYYVVTLDSGKRKRFKKGEHPSYEYSDSEGEYL